MREGGGAAPVGVSQIVSRVPALPIKFVRQHVDLLVHLRDLPLQRRFLVVGLGFGQFLWRPSTIIKPNQIGTLSETVEVAKIAKDAGWQTIFSHRSGETNDDLIADLAVGCGADYVKFGAPSRGERVVKYNRLLKIESELGI